MRYYSTRNKNDAVNFATAALTGLTPDGRLFVPGEIPQYTQAVLSSLGTMDYLSKTAMFHPDCYTLASPSEQKNAEDLMKKTNEAYERPKPAAIQFVFGAIDTNRML